MHVYQSSGRFMEKEMLAYSYVGILNGGEGLDEREQRCGTEICDAFPILLPYLQFVKIPSGMKLNIQGHRQEAIF